MPAPWLTTMKDAIDYLVDYLGGAAEAREYSNVKRAVYDAYREVGFARDWAHFCRHGRVNLNADYSTGTVTYNATTRAVTLAGGAWPSWARYGRILFSGDTVEYLIESRDSDTQVTLDATLCPQASISTATAYTIYRTVYTLPGNLWKLWEINDETGWWSGGPIPPQEWLAWNRHLSTATTANFRWTVFGDPNLYGSKALGIYGYSDTADTLDFMFQAVPRALRYSGVNANDSVGTVSATADSTSIVGVGTSFTSGMVGSIIRLSSTSATQPPTGREGIYPYEEQKVISKFTDATHISVDSAVASDYSGKKYVISDPIDLPEYLLDLFYAAMEKHASRKLTEEHYAIARDRYKNCLHDAYERDADVPVRQPGGWVGFKLPSWARVVNWLLLAAMTIPLDSLWF